jgi:hypothetical protein
MYLCNSCFYYFILLHLIVIIDLNQICFGIMIVYVVFTKDSRSICTNQQMYFEECEHITVICNSIEWTTISI